MRVISRRLPQRVPFARPASAKGATRFTTFPHAPEKAFPYSAPEEDEPVVQIETCESTEASNDYDSESDWESYDIDTSPSRFIEHEEIQNEAPADDDDDDDGDQWTTFHCSDFLASHLFAGACAMHSIDRKRMLKKTRPKTVSLQTFLVKLLGRGFSTADEGGAVGSVTCTSLALPISFKNKPRETKKSKSYKEALVRVHRRIQEKSRNQSWPDRSRQSIQAEFPDSVIRKLERLAALRKRRDSSQDTVKLRRENQSLPSKKALEIFRRQNRIRSMGLHSTPQKESNDSGAMNEVKQVYSAAREQLPSAGTSQSHSLSQHSLSESVEGSPSCHSGSGHKSVSRRRTNNEILTAEKTVDSEDECPFPAEEKITQDASKEEAMHSNKQTHSASTTSDIPAMWKDFMSRVLGKKSI